MRKPFRFMVPIVLAIAIAMTTSVACGLGRDSTPPAVVAPSPAGRQVPTEVSLASASPTWEAPTASAGEHAGTPKPTASSGLRGLVYVGHDGLEVVQGGQRSTVVTWASLQCPGDFVSLSPDGHKLAYTRTGQDLWVTDLTTGRAEPLVEGAIRAEHADVMNTVWSPDGAWLAVVLGRIYKGRPEPERETLFTIEIASGRVFEIASGAHGFTWQRPGGGIAFLGSVGEDYGLFVAQPDGEGKRLLYPGGSLYEPFLAASPRDGTLLVVEGISHLEYGRLVGVSPRDGAAVELVAGGPGLPIFPQWPAWSPDGARIAIQSIGGDVYIVDVATGAVAHVQGDFGGPMLWSPDGTMLAARDYLRNTYCWLSVADGAVKGRLDADAYRLLEWR